MSRFFGRTKFAAGMAVLSAVVLTDCAALSEKQSEKKEGAADKTAISSEDRRPAVTLAYDCENGFHFTASVEGGSEADFEGISARVFLPGETVSLPVVSSASGAKFSNGKVTWWSSKDEALLEYNGRVYQQCRVNRKQSIWEDARLRGVDFRAVGNEPGWHLEISNSEQILFVTNYGEDRYTFPTAEPASDAVTRTTEYKTTAGGHGLTVILEDKSCNDTMVDESYPITVSIQFDGRRHRGCGMLLD